MTELFLRLRKHNVKLSSSEITIGTTDADFLGHTISPAAVMPNAQKREALTKIPMPNDLNQLRSTLSGALSYYKKFLRDIAKRMRPITPLLKQGDKFVFTPALQAIVRKLLTELTTPTVPVYPNWDAATGNSRPFPLYCNVSADGFGTTLAQEQDDHTIRPMVFISHAALESERRWTPLSLEAGSIVWSIKGLRGYFWGTEFRFFPGHKAVESLDKIAEHYPRVQRRVESLTAYSYTLIYRNGSANGNADFLSRLPLPATERDRDGPSNLTPSDEERFFLMRSHGLPLGRPSAVRVGLAELAPSDPSSGLGGLPLSRHDFRVFRQHEPRMRVDDPDDACGEFVARAPPLRHFAKSQLGPSCQHICPRFFRRFCVRSPCCASASFNRRHGPRPTRHFLQAFSIAHQRRRTAL